MFIYKGYRTRDLQKIKQGLGFLTLQYIHYPGVIPVMWVKYGDVVKTRGKIRESTLKLPDTVQNDNKTSNSITLTKYPQSPALPHTVTVRFI